MNQLEKLKQKLLNSVFLKKVISEEELMIFKILKEKHLHNANLSHHIKNYNRETRKLNKEFGMY